MSRLDLAPATALQARLAQAALCTGLMVYLEAVAALVLLTERVLPPAALALILPILVAQFAVARRPVRLLIRDHLIRGYSWFLGLAALFVVLLGLASRTNRLAAAGLGLAVVAVTALPVVRMMRMAREYGAQWRLLENPDCVLECLSFDIRQSIGVKLRSFGHDRRRWAAPFVMGILAGAGAFTVLGLAMQALGLTIGGVVGQASGLVGLWVFYRVIRHVKPRAEQLRQRDTRGPVLILREFGDDSLTTQRRGLGQTFEYVFAAELDRIGPAISVGRPGESLAPLGASRDYLSDADWKHGVAQLIDDAAVVVFLLGDSESVLWEFRTTVAARGLARTLLVVPPLRDRAEIERRWTRFTEATADLIGTRLPRTLPDERVLGCLFAGDDAVLIVGSEHRRAWSWRARSALDYRLAVRLFGCLLRDNPGSVDAVRRFLSRRFPILSLSV